MGKVKLKIENTSEIHEYGITGIGILNFPLASKASGRFTTRFPAYWLYIVINSSSASQAHFRLLILQEANLIQIKANKNYFDWLNWFGWWS